MCNGLKGTSRVTEAAVIERDETFARATHFSGHESFAPRYGWLPKLYEAVRETPNLFRDDEAAILTLGLGKNMVRSIRFWGGAFGLTRQDGHETAMTPFAELLLDPKTGADPYLEAPESLWRLHWMITVHGGLGAWICAFIDNYDLEISRGRYVAHISDLAVATKGAISPSTAAAHADILIRTYADADDGNGGWEERLGSPFQELGLVRQTTVAGTPMLRFPKGKPMGLSAPAFAFALADFWRQAAHGSRTLSFRALMGERGSPGTVFRMDEASMHASLVELASHIAGFQLREDGVGGLVVQGEAGVIGQLEELAWPSVAR